MFARFDAFDTEASKEEIRIGFLSLPQNICHSEINPFLETGQEAPGQHSSEGLPPWLLKNVGGWLDKENLESQGWNSSCGDTEPGSGLLSTRNPPALCNSDSVTLNKLCLASRHKFHLGEGQCWGRHGLSPLPGLDARHYLSREPVALHVSPQVGLA